MCYQGQNPRLDSHSSSIPLPIEASQLLSNQQVGEVYLQMCELIAVNIWEKLDQHKKVNPGFNSRDEMHYKKAMKEVSIYDIKTSFLESKGFQQAWGAPNEVFYKIIESLKQRSN